MREKTERDRSTSAAMRLAWSFVREAELPLGEAMHRAYLNLKLQAKLALGEPTTIAYRKADGTIRGAIALAATVGEALVQGTGSKTPAHNYLYYDVSRNGFRSFRRSNLLAVD